MGRESSEILWLESDDDWFGEVGLDCEGGWLSSVVTSMAELFTHKTITVVSIEWRLCDMLISSNIARPWEIRPAHSSDCCMYIARFDRIEVSPVIEKIPFYCSNDVRFAAFGVELGELPPRIADENASKAFLDVL